MNNLQQRYSRPFTYALILHVILLSVLFIDLDFPSQPRLATENNKNTVNIVKAVAVQQNKVEEEMNRLTAEREQKQAADEAKQQKLAKQAARALQQRKQEQAKLQHMQEQLKMAEKQRAAQQEAAQKQLEKIKQAQETENKRLTKIKEQQVEAQAQQKRQADLAAKQKVVADQQRKKDFEQQVQEEAQSSQMQSEIDKYKALVISAIQNNWNYPDNATQDMTCLLQIKLGPGGVVLSVAVVQSSGNTPLDRSAEVAVYKASPLPVPADPALFDKFRTLNLKVRPQGKVSA